MGYDMYMVKTPQPSKEDLLRAEKLEKQAKLAGEESNKAREDALKKYGSWNDIPDEEKKDLDNFMFKSMELSGEAYEAKNPGYFRLNIWGMGVCREVMSKLGMLDVDYTMDGKPPWPNYEQFEDDDEAYDKACEAPRSWNPNDPVTGIAIHKLGSNDGWIVTPEECIAAVKAFNDADLSVLDEELPSWFPGWIEFLKKSSTAGGFTVW